MTVFLQSCSAAGRKIERRNAKGYDGSVLNGTADGVFDSALLIMVSSVESWSQPVVTVRHV
jgi:hypothetical protein